MKIKRIAFGILCACFCIALSAADGRAGDKAAASAEPQVNVEKMREKYPDADTVLTTADERVTYQKDGSAHRTETFSVRILTEKGRRNYRNISWFFDSNYETQKLTGLKVVKSDGSVVVYPPDKHSHTTIDSDDAASNIFSDSMKKLNVTLPDLAVGDTVTVSVSYHLFKPRMPGQWSYFGVLQTDMPVEHYRFTVDAPAELPLKSVVLKDEVPGCVKREKKVSGDRIIYSWTAENVPQLIAENFMPPMYACAQRVLLSTVEKWEDISRWYADLCEPHLEVNKAITEKVASITGDKKSDAEKINALFRFVSQKIRYIGLTDEKNAPGYEPHDVTRTFERGNGVCRDKAALLTAMLRCAGFKAYPVLFMAGYRKDSEVPNMYFNHAICAVESAPGKYILMDPTDETAKELFPAYLANCSYLVARKDGDTLRCSPAVAAEKNRVVINTECSIDEQDRLSGETGIEFIGIYDNYYRSFMATHREEFRKYFTRILRDNLPGAEIDKLKITPENVMDMSEVLKVKISFHADDITADHSAAQPLVLPELSGTLGFMNNIYRAAELKKRNFPLLTQTRSVRENISLKLPDKLVVKALPERVKADKNGILRMERAVEHDTRTKTLRLKRFLAIDAAEVSRDKYAFFRSALQTFDRSAKQLPIVQFDFDHQSGSSFAGASSLLVSEDREIILEKDGSWSDVVTVRRKILNYAGAYLHSTLKEIFVPGFEELSVSGYTLAPDGTKRELKANEINIIDAPWNSEVKRYPAGKMLTAAFPAVVPGSEICYTLKRDVTGRILFNAAMQGRGNAPAMFRRLKIHYPEKRRLRSSAGSLTFAVKRSVDSAHRAVITAETSDQLRLPEESSLPPAAEFSPVFTVSDRNYREFGTALDGALRSVITVPGEFVRKTTEKVISGEVTEIGKIRKIHAFVTRNIRSAGPAMNMVPWSAFSAPEVTLKSGVGNSADRALLYAAMCDISGIKWHFIAVSDVAATKESSNHYSHFPEDIFHGVLVYLPDHNIYLNDNGFYGVIGGANSENKLALELQSGHLMPVRPKQKFLSAMQSSYRIKIDKSGNAVVNVEHKLSGGYFEDENRRFSTFTPETRRRHFEKLTSQISRSAEFVSGSSDFKDYPGKISYTVKVPSFLGRSGNFRSFTLPGFEELRRAAATDCSRRILPYLRKNEIALEKEYIIDFPDELKVSRLRDSRREYGRRYGSFYQETSFIGKNKIVLNCRLLLPVESVRPQDFGTVLQLNKLLNEPDTARILFSEAEEKKR